ncbi:MAG: 30S ribosomal protein S8 [Planctomycetes bacterium]|nr:30S ribosomal protein S8 [Planctomycetota bacterium]
MTMTDPIADMLTRMRNAIAVRKQKVDVPTSLLKASIADVLRREGFIGGYEIVADGRTGLMRIDLKYDSDGVPAITTIARESKPGRRRYCRVADVPKVLGGLGIAILSTPKGVLSDREARRERVGGEFLCTVC